VSGVFSRSCDHVLHQSWCFVLPQARMTHKCGHVMKPKHPQFCAVHQTRAYASRVRKGRPRRFGRGKAYQELIPSRHYHEWCRPGTHTNDGLTLGSSALNSSSFSGYLSAEGITRESYHLSPISSGGYQAHIHKSKDIPKPNCHSYYLFVAC
jgi:hypothetical protein